MVKHLIRIILLAGLLSLSACSTLTELRQDFADRVFGREPANPPAELEDIKPYYNARVDWSVQTGDTGRFDYTPALEADMVYMASSKGELTKLDAKDGRQQWRVNVGEPISGGVGSGGGLVLVGTSKGHVIAFDTAGKQVWKAQVSSEVLSVPRYFDGLVIARSGDSHIFGLDAATGERKWVYERAAPALSLRSSAGLVVDGGAVYAGFAGGKMVAIRADNGKLLWEAAVAQPKGVTEIERIAEITSLPIVSGPVVYAVAYQGRVAAVDRRSGKVVWNRDISSYSGIEIDGNRLYLSHTLGSVYSLDYETGKTFWRQGALSNRRLSVPVPLDGLTAVGDLEGYVHFLAYDDGSFASRIKVDSDPVMSMVRGNSGNQVLVATRGGGLYAVSTSQMANAAKGASESTSQPARRESTHSDVPWPVPKGNSEPAPAEKPATEMIKEQSTSDIEKTITETVQPPASPTGEVTPADTAPPAPAEGGANADSIMFRKDPLAPEAGQ